MSECVACRGLNTTQKRCGLLLYCYSMQAYGHDRLFLDPWLPYSQAVCSCSFTQLLTWWYAGLFRDRRLLDSCISMLYGNGRFLVLPTGTLGHVRASVSSCTALACLYLMATVIGVSPLLSFACTTSVTLRLHISNHSMCT